MARSTVTWKQINSDVRMLTGAKSAEKITDVNLLSRGNIVNHRIYSLLNGARFVRFFAHCPMPITHGGFEKKLLADTATYTGATKTFTCTITSASVGDMIMWTDGSTNTWFSTVATAYAGGVFTVARGGSQNISTDGLQFILFKVGALTTESVNGLRINKIDRIHFPNAGDAPQLNDDEIEYASSNSNLDNKTVFSFTGDTSGNESIKFACGSGVTNYGGFPIIFFEERPAVATAVTDYVDLPLEFHLPLVKEMARLTLLEMQSQVPKQLESPLMTLGIINEGFQAGVDAISADADKGNV